MPRQLHVFHEGRLDGATNMARDEHLMHSETLRPAALRTYAWNPYTISLGCFQRYAEIETLPPSVRDWPVVRRPTGGGAILHGHELTYCVCVDDSIDVARRAPAALYELIHGLWREAIVADGPPIESAPEHLPFPSPRHGPFLCFQTPGRTDLILHQGKVLGSAQRRIPGRVMQHGSLVLHRAEGLPGADLGNPPPERVLGWIDRFVDSLALALNLTRHTGVWSPDSLADAAKRRARYLDDAWTRRR